MKLRRLDLLRYGHLSDVVLNFPDDASLHVVHGANEAGKSTALAAVADALFGFGHRTDFDFLHGGPQLRVGFALSASDGTEGDFVRRKGRRDTLRDAADQAVPEDVLRRFLGGASRELFERSFGLDGARLREGGRELLLSGGEAGESLLASTGLLNLRAALAALEEEAKTLVGDGRGRRRLSEATEAWREAQRASEERAVAPRAWLEAETAHADAVASLSDVQEETRTLAAEDSRLQRVRRVAPLLAELAAVREGFAMLADAPQLPPEAESRRQTSLTARREAMRDAERETMEVTSLTGLRAALPQDAAVLEVQDAIDALGARRSIVLQATEDLPKVHAQVAANRATVTEALEDLAIPLAPEAARDAVPATALRRAVQRLINQHAGLAAMVASASRSLGLAQRQRNQAEEALQASPLPPSPALLRRTIDAVRGEGPLDVELERAERVLAGAEAATTAMLLALPLWRGELASLVACRLPLPAEADAATAQLEAAARAHTDGLAAVAALTAEINEREEEVSRLAHGETVPTPDVVAAARSVRDRAWRLIRRVYDGGKPPDVDERAGLPTGPLPDTFEELRDDADRLVDRRADDAQRVADFLTATARLTLLRGRRAETDAAVAGAQMAAAEAEEVWRAAWAPADLVPEAPSAMAEWRRERTEVLKQGELGAEARLRRDDLDNRRDRARIALRSLLMDTVEQETLAALLLRAETQCEAAEAAAEAHRRQVDSLAQAEARLPDLQDSANAAAAALEAWQHEWTGAVVSLDLPEVTSVDAAEAALGAWTRIAEIASAWRTGQQRISDMEAGITAFANEVAAVQGRLSESVADEPASVIAARLARRVAGARKAALDAAALTDRIVAHETAAGNATRRLRAAEEDLAALRGLAGAADDAALERAIDRARRRDAAGAQIARLGQALVVQGDGSVEDALRADVAGVDPDVVVARLTDIQSQLTILGERRESLSAERTRAETKLTEMRDGRDAVSKAQEAEDALADACAAAERYARLHVARVLLRAGIDRFRGEQQGPLLSAAGGHFALLTGDRYRRLLADEDSSGRTFLHAIQDTGTECPVEALSEGARDQLYLALRVAAIEGHVANAEPLPFIADDLLVNFDDTRAAAAIALLSELGRATQVILFTHHDHIATLAARQTGVVVQHLPPLIATATLLPEALAVR
jgi:chromosome segregation protein